MGEMVGKLKDLGNTFLGSPHNEGFGMICDESPQVTSASRQTISNLSRTARGGILSTSRDGCSEFQRFRVRTRPCLRESGIGLVRTRFVELKVVLIARIREYMRMGFGIPQRSAGARSD